MNGTPEAYGNLQALMQLLSGAAGSFPGPTGAPPMNPGGIEPGMAPSAMPTLPPALPPMGPQTPGAWTGNQGAPGNAGYLNMGRPPAGEPWSFPSMPSAQATPSPAMDDTGGAGAPGAPGIEGIAAQMAATGTPPPVGPISLGPQAPALTPPSGAMGASYAPARPMPSPMARDPWAGLREDSVPASPTATAAGTAPKSPLQGVKAPPAPTPQRVATPGAPRPSGSIEGNNIARLLQQMYGQVGQRQAGLALPASLGAALGRR